MINDAVWGDPPETHFYTDFTTAGQDAFAMVVFLVFYGDNAKLKHKTCRSQHFL